MSYHLVCVHPFHGYEKGQLVTDSDEIAKLLRDDRDHHFVKIPDSAASAPAPRQKAK